MSTRKIIRVSDVMQTKLDVVDGMETVAHALQTMLHAATKTLVVKKRHTDDELGMVLLSDIARQVLARDRAPERVNIYEIMTKPVIQVHPGMDIRYCARLFDRFNIHQALVVDDGKLVGLVSYTDMVIKGLLKKDAGDTA